MSKSFAEYKRVTRDSIAGLQRALDSARHEIVELAYRAEIAERQVRQLSAERDIWKRQAKHAQAELQSTGRAR
jgi:hypothetical protein